MVTMKSKSLRGSLFQRKSNSRSAQLPKSLSVQMAPAVKLHSRNGNSTLGRKGTYDRQIPTKQIEPHLSLSKEVRFLVEKKPKRFQLHPVLQKTKRAWEQLMTSATCPFLKAPTSTEIRLAPNKRFGMQMPRYYFGGDGVTSLIEQPQSSHLLLALNSQNKRLFFCGHVKRADQQMEKKQ